MIKNLLTTLICLFTILLQSACATHSSSNDTPLLRKFSVKPIIKKQDETTNTSSNSLSNYELSGVVGTATLNLSD